MSKLIVCETMGGAINTCPLCGNKFFISNTEIAALLGSRGGLKRKQNLTPVERSRQASKASRIRWDKVAKITTDALAKKVVKTLMEE